MEEAEYHRIAEAEDRHWWYQSTRALARQLLEPWLRPGLRSIDIGCGPGGNGAWLAAYGPMAALDIEMVALEYVSHRRPELAPACASAEALPIAAASVDVALVLTVLYHVEDHARAVREVAHVLKPGGVALFIEPAFRLLRREHDISTHGLRRYRCRDLARLASDAGLSVERTTYAKSFLFVPAAAIALGQRIARRATTPGAARSDLEPRAIEKLATPVLRSAARAENRLLRRSRLPFGTSAIVLATRPA